MYGHYFDNYIGSPVKIVNIRVPEPFDIDTEIEVEFTSKQKRQYASFLGERTNAKREARAVGKTKQTRSTPRCSS